MRERVCPPLTGVPVSEGVQEYVPSPPGEAVQVLELPAVMVVGEAVQETVGGVAVTVILPYPLQLSASLVSVTEPVQLSSMSTQRR